MFINFHNCNIQDLYYFVYSCMFIIVIDGFEVFASIVIDVVYLLEIMHALVLHCKYLVLNCC